MFSEIQFLKLIKKINQCFHPSVNEPMKTLVTDSHNDIIVPWWKSLHVNCNSRITNTGFIQDKVQIKCTNYVFTLNSGLSICFLSTFRCRILNLFLFSQSFTAWFTYAKILLLNLRARSSREYSSVEAIHIMKRQNQSQPI